MLTIVPSNQFKKDLKIAKKRGLNLEKLTFVINTLASENKLDEKYRDHSLSGVLKEFRECHIEPDWLLVYRIDHDELILFLFSHWESFGLVLTIVFTHKKQLELLFRFQLFFSFLDENNAYIVRSINTECP